MTYVLFCDKCKLGSFCDEKIEHFICDSCNQADRLNPEDIECNSTLPIGYIEEPKFTFDICDSQNCDNK